MTINKQTTITKERTQKIIDAANEVISALAGNNDDVHPNDTAKICQLYDDLNDHCAPPKVVLELACIALALLDAKPVAFINGAGEPVLYGEHIGIAVGTHLYTDPQPVPHKGVI
ncbi:hypothetical protein [Salmonella enterica]|uniref:hypothetical protein n=1 Tax=Salmonella enterica TaxID=28901 RepID=UPI001BAFA8BA